MAESIVYFRPVNDHRDKSHVKAVFKDLIRDTGFCETIGRGEFVPIKMHMGEQGNRGHVAWEVVKALVDKLKSRAAKPFVTDTNVLYQGRRMNAVDHLILADEHGFNLRNLGCPVIICDGLFGESAEDVKIGLKHFDTVNIAKPVLYTENLVSIAHVTSHMLTGFAASVKNIGMGLASRAGKLCQHSNIKPSIRTEKCVLCGQCLKTCPELAITEEAGKARIVAEKCVGCSECVVSCRYDAVSVNYGENVDLLVEKMAEYCLGALKNVKKKMFFNFAMKITRNCDCLAKDEPSICEDVGIFASEDPVACDLAAAELTMEKAGKNVFQEAFPAASEAARQLAYASRIGLGNLSYELRGPERG